MDRDLIVFESPEWQMTDKAAQLLASKGNLQKKICSFGGNEILQFLGAHQAQSIHGIFVSAKQANDRNLVQFIEGHALRNQVILVEPDDAVIDPFSSIHTFTRVRNRDLEDTGLLDHLLTATSTKRASGLKAFLERGTSIYAENIFRPSGLGIKLDPCFQLAASHMGETRALNAWSILNIFVFHSFVSLNQYFEETSNKRTKIQIGIDDKKLCIGVSYPVTDETVKDLFYGLQDLYTGKKDNHWLGAWKEASYLEVTHYHASKRGEIIAFFEKKPTSKYLPFVVRDIKTAELESVEDAKAYTYKLFSAVKEAIESGDTKIVAGAKPKVKLSDRMNKLAEKHGGQKTVIKGVTDTIQGGTTVIKGGETAAEAKDIKISGVTQHIVTEMEISIAAPPSQDDIVAAAEALTPDTTEGEDAGDENDILAAIAAVAGEMDDDEEEAGAAPAAAPAPVAAKAPVPKPAGAPVTVVASAAPAKGDEKGGLDKLFSMEGVQAEKDPGKLQKLLADKLQSAKDIISQREGLIKDLNKKIEEILDPTKSGVVTGVVDQQKEGLKQNVTRLETELVDAGKREKELMTSVDKAVQAKDEALKKLKALEAKVQATDQANAAKIQKLEKAMELEKQKVSDLTKRLSAASDKKAA